MFHAEDGKLAGGMHFVTGEESHPVAMGRGPEFDAAIWAFENRKSSDSEECPLKGREYLYIPVISDENVYGVLGVRAPSARPEIFENGMLQSLLGECGLALENHRNTKLREEAAVLAENEKLRANLLRSISHDLRTPLTSISGNADTLRKQWRKLDGETRESLLQDIEDDADWLRELVENLLSITRMGDGKVKLDVSDYVLGDILSDAVRHVDRRSERHRISVAYDDEPLLVRCDAKLIVQVIVNLVNNAIKYTPEGSEIRIIGGRMGDRARVTVTDNGTGIPDDLKDQVFEMFYTGDRRNGDSSRSLGLGLPLCKTIMDAHGEKLTLTDNIPHGCVFTFTLPLSEVDLNE